MQLIYLDPVFIAVSFIVIILDMTNCHILTLGRIHDFDSALDIAVLDLKRLLLGKDNTAKCFPDIAEIRPLIPAIHAIIVISFRRIFDNFMRALSQYKLSRRRCILSSKFMICPLLICFIVYSS